MLKAEWEQKKSLIENYLKSIVNCEHSLDKTLYDAMAYSLMAGGKRLRPVLLMAAAEAVGGEGKNCLPVAAALEMIHTYSLIHDDLPAMDNDDYRRGKLTNHKVYGEGMAILAGDALLTLAFQTISRQEAEASCIVKILSEIASAAGSCGMVGGQALDIEAEQKQLSLDELKTLHMGKTGALFRAALRSGAILGGASKDQLKALTAYAEAFGLAFQITDDILDVIGDEALVGKPIGSDERNNKSTYVSLTSLEEATYLADAAVSEALAALDNFGEEANFLRDMVRYIARRNQ